MNSVMITFLQSIGALVGDANTNGDCKFAAEPASFDNLDAQNVIVPLSHYGLLEVKGPDAEKFLQGQITCNAAETTATLSTPGAYCTPKGRVITSFQLLRPQPDAFWLRMRADLLDITARAFGKYIVFSKAKLSPTESMIGIGLHGSSIASILSELIGTLPAHQHGTVSFNDGLLLRCDADGTQFEFWGPAEAVSALWSHCAPRAVAIGSHYWRWLQIRAGNAEISAATSETFLPHMLNYHETGAINFKKGCYTGQEIVARTHYRGQVKRHIARLALDGAAPAPGSDITNMNDKVVGTIVDSVATGPNAAELLTVLADESLDSSTPLQAGGIKVRPLALPYAIP